MKDSENIEKGLISFFGKPIYFWLACLGAVPIWFGLHAFASAMHIHEDEAMATITTICYVLGVFAGRYIVQIWATTRNTISSSLTTILSIFVIVDIIWLFFHADFPFENRPAINLMLFWIPFILLSLATGILIKLLRLIPLRQIQEARISAQVSKSELGLLQSQLSPHFLFNTLNNLYGISISNHEKLPDLLLKLAELLRYSVYEAKEIFVPLKDELAYIHNYIEFEKLRIGDRLVLKTDVENVENTSIKIAPMLLIVFIENAFKHSKNTAEDKIFIEISVKSWGNSILFSSKNSHSIDKNVKDFDPKKSGLGLENVRKRLELLYHNEYNLEIENEEKSYSVMLRLKQK